ncbi:MAG TPA: hypothetical protein VL947_02365, partial [Cytophagales bacterium]|nr:hypothetical protein [Cytophagales bacterium]
MTQVYATPGVYIEEKSAFPSSGVAVATAVPAFIGYTQKHVSNNKSLLNKPTRINSLAEYHQYFGGAPQVKFKIESDPQTKFKLSVVSTTKFNLYNAMRLFFANGGSTCYIVSVGVYDPVKGVESSVLNPDAEGGIKTLLKEPEPTMVVVPDAVLLSKEDCYSLQQDMLIHCGVDTRSRVALLDVYEGYREGADVITDFRNGIGNNHLQWGAAYYPWVETTVVSDSEVSLDNIDMPETELKKILEAEIALIYPQKKDKDDKLVDDPKFTLLKGELDKLGKAEEAKSLHQTLSVTIPIYKAIVNELRFQLNVQAPSGGMAGVISMVDHTA